jgi:hypothetical protein
MRKFATYNHNSFIPTNKLISMQLAFMNMLLYHIIKLIKLKVIWAAGELFKNNSRLSEALFAANLYVHEHRHTPLQ